MWKHEMIVSERKLKGVFELRHLFLRNPHGCAQKENEAGLGWDSPMVSAGAANIPLSIRITLLETMFNGPNDGFIT